MNPRPFHDRTIVRRSEGTPSGRTGPIGVTPPGWKHPQGKDDVLAIEELRL
jgi:hypothetical protein